MTLIERINSIANKVGVKTTGSTISELLKSLDEGLDKKSPMKKDSVYKPAEQKRETKPKRTFSED